MLRETACVIPDGPLTDCTREDSCCYLDDAVPQYSDAPALVEEWSLAQR